MGHPCFRHPCPCSCRGRLWAHPVNVTLLMTWLDCQLTTKPTAYDVQLMDENYLRKVQLSRSKTPLLVEWMKLFLIGKIFP